MTASEALGLFTAAVLASALNAVAGGGGFIAFPSLVFTQVMPLEANAITAVSLWPGSLASMGAYRRRLSLPFKPLVLLISSSTLGGIVGAWLVLHTPPAVFTRLVPFLLLAATLLFMFSSRLVKSIATPDRSDALRGRLLFWSAFIQFLVGIYGGYFGAGLGILILASLALTGMEDIHQMNALKVVLVLCNNGLSALTFLLAGVVLWPQASTMMLGAVAGGYAGAHYSKCMKAIQLRWLVALVGLVMSGYFFARYY